ncbi:MAG: 5-bromo-4-chloroindolyl phosphate hydrolysis family protein [Parasporobacterium sp.]|nr:5-bromo-4-chloroindolyl phosphate hydrolysis family protein [Parasporobacterium sp.]
MKGKRSLGCLGGVIAIIVLVVALALVHRFVPSIFTAFAWIAGIAAVVLIAVIVLIVLLANKAIKSLKKEDPKPKQEPPKTQTSTSNLPPEQAAVINKGRADLMNVRRILVKIHNPEVSKAGLDICASLDKLLQALRDKPEKINGCRQFLNYYIPTLGEVLTKYSRLETNGVVTAENTEKVINFLIDFRKASGKEYQSLFEDDKLDMTVDIEAMTIAIKRDGLLDEDFTPEAKPGEPTLIIDSPNNSVVVEDDMTVVDAVNQAAGKEPEKEPEKEKDLVH